MQLRDYQRAAIDNLYAYWAEGRGTSPLVIAPTGAGKTPILATITSDFIYYGCRVLILTHVAELLKQGAEELAGILPGADIGFYSASLGKKSLDHAITFAGIQSVWERAFDFIPAPDVVIIDEAHLCPKNSETRYGKFLADLRIANPKVKMVGLTATPYRLDSGYLHKGKGAIFDGIAYDIPVGMLMDQGFLSPVISKGGAQHIDLTNVKVSRGDFNEHDLAVAASDPELVRSTVAEIVSLGVNRKSWLVFASGVNHAEMILAEMESHGISCKIITGDTKNRSEIIDEFKSFGIRCLVNVNVLTTGFNAPAVDLVAIVRATMSPSLYVQIVGRGTRLYQGKENCLVLDYGQNVERHGFIDAVRVKERSGSGDGTAPVKECPTCHTHLPAGLRRCYECGHEFPAPELNHGTRSYGGAILSTDVVPEWVEVDSVTYAIHKKAGKPDSVKVSYVCGIKVISEWLCPEHGGYAQSRYKSRMGALGATAETTADALIEAPLSWTIPGRIKIKPRADDPRFDEIVQLDYMSGRKPSVGEEIDWDGDWNGSIGDDIEF